MSRELTIEEEFAMINSEKEKMKIPGLMEFRENTKNGKKSKKRKPRKKSGKKNEKKEGSRFGLVIKTIAWLILIQGIVGYGLYCYSSYNHIIDHIENPPTITEIKTVEKEVIIEKEATPVVSEAYGGPETPQEAITRVSRESGYNRPDLLIAIAECESGSRKAGLIRPDVPNGQSSALGAFQYLKGTWEEAVQKAGKDWTLEDRTDIEKSTRMAIWHISRGYLKKWNASKHCWGDAL